MSLTDGSGRRPPLCERKNQNKRHFRALSGTDAYPVGPAWSTILPVRGPI